MTEKELMKVYELAKELGTDSFSLLDKLKTLNIIVKSHMSDLSDQDVQMVRDAMSGKKHAGAEKAGAPRAAPKSSVAKTRKKVAEAAPPLEPSPKTAAPAAAPTAVGAEDKKSGSSVIRRRTKSDGEIETKSNHPKAAAAAAAAAAAEQQAAQELAESQEIYSEEATDEAQAEVYQEEAPATQEEQSQITAADVTLTTTAPASTTEAETPAAPSVTKAARAPIVLPPRPVAPRRSILKIVEAVPPPARPMIKPVGSPITPAGKVPAKGPTTDGFRIIKMTKENLDQMVEEEAAKKRGGGREGEIRPEDVRFADYRKKEVIFLPRRKKLPVGKNLKKTEITKPKAQKRVVVMEETISVQDLAQQLNIKAVDVVRKLMGMGQMATINQSLDFDTATLIGMEYQYEVRNVAFKEEALIEKSEDAPEALTSRPPVVTVMGHVDHGKTSLLDAIRSANVAAGEAGGITQHIGAYTVEQNGKLITFIDTPGHEAFTVMRARGANVTDIVILVVAADDGVMPQTREALAHAKAAKVPIIVAVNKIDKPGANPEKIKQVLAEMDLLAEDWGGETMFVPVSAIKRTNIDKLLESILLQAEVLDLKANADTRGTGTILEARLEKGRGPVASVLVRRGTLRVGDAIVSGQFAGRIKAMLDDKGNTVKVVGPGMAAECLGFEGVPSAGERFDSVATEADARVIAEKRIDQARAKISGSASKMSLDDLFSKIQAGVVKELNIVLKGDVFGSVEAVRDSLLKASTDKVKVKVLHSATGGITESDVLLGAASEAIIVGFNVRPETKARQMAEAQHVEIKCYNIIYELIDDIKKSMAGLLDKKKVEKFLGRAEVRQTFTVPKIGVIAGSSVVDGKIIRGANVRLLRESRIIYEGKMSSLKRFKDDAKEVATGYECGIGLENYNDLKPGDLIEAYQIELITPELNA